MVGTDANERGISAGTGHSSPKLCLPKGADKANRLRRARGWGTEADIAASVEDYRYWVWGIYRYLWLFPAAWLVGSGHQGRIRIPVPVGLSRSDLPKLVVRIFGRRGKWTMTKLNVSMLVHDVFRDMFVD